MNYKLGLEEVKELLEDKNNTHKAEKKLYEVMFRYAEDMNNESSENSDIMTSLYNLFYYVKRINLTNKIPTACVNLITGNMDIGVNFFKEKINSIEDCMFIIFHERNHRIIDFVSKKTKSYDIDKSVTHELINFAEDGYINGNVLNFISSDLPEKYYNDEEVKEGEKLQYSYLSSNTYGFYKYLQSVCKDIDFEKYLKSFTKKNSGKFANNMIESFNNIKDLSCLVLLLHNELYKNIKSSNLIRNNAKNNEEKSFYKDIENFEVSFEYIDWMNAFFKWHKSLPKDEQKNFDDENNVSELVIDSENEESYGGDDTKNDNNKESSSGSGNKEDKENKDSNKGNTKEEQENQGKYKKSDETREKINAAKIVKETGKCSKKPLENGYYHFPEEESKEEQKVKRIIKDVMTSNEKDKIGKNVDEYSVRMKSNVLQVVANNIAKNIISCNVNNHDMQVGSFIMPSSFARKDLFTMGAGHNPIVYTKNISLGGIKFKLYVDVSGSMDKYLPIVGKLTNNLKEYVDRVFMFSTEVREQPLTQLDRYFTTGGTDFDVVAESIINNKFNNVIILTDGESYMTAENKEKMKRFVKNLYYIHVGSNNAKDVFADLTNHKIENISELI